MANIIFENAPIYDAKRKCPKCDHEHVKSIFIKKNEKRDGWTYPNECILRVCGNCNYESVEKPKK